MGHAATLKRSIKMDLAPSIFVPNVGELHLNEEEILDGLWHRAYEGDLEIDVHKVSLIVHADASSPEQLKTYGDFLEKFLGDQLLILKRSRWKLWSLFFSYRYIFPYRDVMRQMLSLQPHLIRLGEPEGYVALYDIPEPMVRSFGFADIELVFDEDLKVIYSGFDG